MRKTLMMGLTAVVVVLAFGATGYAEDNGPKSSYGIRAGFGLEPDQFVVGAQAEFGRFAKVLRFAPSFDLGFGDEMATYTGNADLRLDLIPLPKSGAVFYTDLGATLTHFDPSEGDGDTEVGLSVVGGVQLPMGRSNSYNIEARFGIGDIPDFRFLVGVFFGGADRGTETVVKEK